MPVAHLDAELAGEVEEGRLVEPADQRLLGLGRQVDQHAPVRPVGRRLGDAVEALGAVDDHGRREAGVEAQQRTVGAVGVETHEGQPLVDEVLGDEAGDDRLADAALLASDEIDARHAILFRARRGRRGRGTFGTLVSVNRGTPATHHGA